MYNKKSNLLTCSNNYDHTRRRKCSEYQWFRQRWRLFQWYSETPKHRIIPKLRADLTIHSSYPTDDPRLKWPQHTSHLPVALWEDSLSLLWGLLTLSGFWITWSSARYTSGKVWLDQSQLRTISIQPSASFFNVSFEFCGYLQFLLPNSTQSSFLVCIVRITMTWRNENLYGYPW